MVRQVGLTEGQQAALATVLGLPNLDNVRSVSIHYSTTAERVVNIDVELFANSEGLTELVGSLAEAVRNGAGEINFRSVRES